jgi:hypothetical protein
LCENVPEESCTLMEEEEEEEEEVLYFLFFISLVLSLLYFCTK